MQPLPSGRGRQQDMALQACLFLAVTFHVVALMAFVLFLPDRATKNGFFHGMLPDVKLHEVSLVEIARPAPPPKPVVPPPPPKTLPQHVLPQRVVPKVVTPVAPHPAAPERIVNRVPGSGDAPKVVTSNQGTSGMVVNSGNGTGIHGTGPGQGSGYGQGTGPPGNGSGYGSAPGGQGAAQSDEVTSVMGSWNGFADSTIPGPPPAIVNGLGHITDWQTLCRSTGLNWDQLKAQSKIMPYQVHVGVAQVSELEGLHGATGVVNVRVTVNPDCSKTVQLTSRSGNSEIDRIGYEVAMTTEWLPGLEYGTPVAMTINYPITFTTNRRGAPGAQPGGPGPGGGAPAIPPGGAPPGY